MIRIPAFIAGKLFWELQVDAFDLHIRFFHRDEGGWAELSSIGL